MIKILVVDDELSAHSVIENLLKHTLKEEYRLLKSCYSVDEALEAIKKDTPDLVFLDINMPEKDGFMFLEEAGEIDFNVVFTTAYDQFAIQAIKNNALDYLLKPISPMEFKDTIKRFLGNKNKADLIQKLNDLRTEISSPNKRLKLASSEGFDFVQAEDISFVSADGNYSQVFLRNGKKVLISKTLKTLEKQLVSERFFRVHKSFLVNLNEVVSYSKMDKVLKLSSSEEIPVSYRKEEDFLNAI